MSIASLTFVKLGLYFSFIFLKNKSLFSSERVRYNSVISLATAIPKAAPLFEIKSSHKDKIVSKSFFLITFFLKSFSPASAMEEMICLKLNIGNDYHK